MKLLEVSLMAWLKGPVRSNRPVMSTIGCGNGKLPRPFSSSIDSERCYVNVGFQPLENYLERHRVNFAKPDC